MDSADTPPRPRPAIPRETLAAVRAGLAPLADEIVAAVRNDHPAYAQVLDAPEGMGIRLGIEQAIHGFVETVEAPGRADDEAPDVWGRLGRAEFQAGRSLEGLQAAFRTGARAAWRGAAALAQDAGIEGGAIAALAEEIFAYIDMLTGEVLEGYVRAQSDEAGEHERRRRRLAGLLLDADDHDPETVERAATLARWVVPRTLAALAVAEDAPGRIAARLDTDALAGSDAAGSWLLIPDPDGPGRGSRLRRALRDVRAALGPTVAPRDVVRSLQWARLTLALVQRGALPYEAPTRTSAHLATVVLMQDDELARALVTERLAPLNGARAADRQRLTETLDAWLAHQRHTPSVAAQLHVHPQTVRYRIGRLRELLGDALDTPDGRFELELALRAQRALAE